MATYITPALVSYSSYHCSNGEYALDGNLTTRCSSNFMVSSRVDIELETSGYEVSEIKIYTENVDKVTVYDRTNNGWSWLTANTNITDGWNIVTIPTSLNYDWIDVRAESSDDTTYSYVYEIELGVENVATPTINNYPTNFDISLEQPAIFEIGKVTLDHNYTTLNFNGSYTNPVVVGQAVYVNDQNPKSIRVRNVTSTSCEIKLHNPSGLAITAEECFYMVAEEGIHEIDTGTFMEVGKVNVVDHIGKNDTLNDTYSNISLNHSWTTPVVFGQVMTENSVDWVEEKIINISSTSFDLSLENAESHLHSIAEDVGYIVFESNLNVVINGVRIQTGNTSNTISGYGNNSGVGENFTFPTVFSKNPLMIVEDRTRNGADGGWLVLIGNPTTTSFNVILDEDMIGDTERNHTTEEGSWIAFEDVLTIGGSSGGGTPVTFNYSVNNEVGINYSLSVLSTINIGIDNRVLFLLKCDVGNLKVYNYLNHNCAGFNNYTSYLFENSIGINKFYSYSTLVEVLSNDVLSYYNYKFDYKIGLKKQIYILFDFMLYDQEYSNLKGNLFIKETLLKIISQKNISRMELIENIPKSILKESITDLEEYKNANKLSFIENKKGMKIIESRGD